MDTCVWLVSLSLWLQFSNATNSAAGFFDAPSPLDRTCSNDHLTGVAKINVGGKQIIIHRESASPFSVLYFHQKRSNERNSKSYYLEYGGHKRTVVLSEAMDQHQRLTLATESQPSLINLSLIGNYCTLSFPGGAKWELDLDTSPQRMVFNLRQSPNKVSSLIVQSSESSGQTTLNATLELFSGQQLALLVNHSTSLNRDWSTSYVFSSSHSDQKIQGTATATGTMNGGRRIQVATDIGVSVQYQLSYIQSPSSPFVQLTHKITSPLFSFEGNMTVSEEGEDGARVTKITQKTRSPVWSVLYSDLRQIFHQSTDDTFWETAVSTSGLFDMHVTARWLRSVWHFYRKIFQFRSHFERLLPSLTLRLDYSDGRHFHHEFHFPLLAVKYRLWLDLADSLDSMLPLKLSVAYQDEFSTNDTRTLWIATVSRTSESWVRCEWAVQPQFWPVLESAGRRFEQIWSYWQDMSRDAGHPLNRLLSTVFTLPNGDLASWLQQGRNWLERQFPGEMKALSNFLWVRL